MRMPPKGVRYPPDSCDVASSRAICILAARPILSFRCFSRRSMRRSRRSCGVSFFGLTLSGGGMIFIDGETVVQGGSRQLLERALARGLIEAPAQKFRAMPKAVAGDMIEADLHNQFRA